MTDEHQQPSEKDSDTNEVRPKLWTPYCFKCRKHVDGADWSRLQCTLRWSKKCDQCGKRSAAPSVLFRNVLLLPLCLLIGSYLALWVKGGDPDASLATYADSIAPVLAFVVIVIWVIPSWIGWIRYCNHFGLMGKQTSKSVNE